MKILRKLKEKNSLKIQELRATPNTEDEIKVIERLKDRARRKGITVIDEPENTSGGGYMQAGWKWKDIPEYVIKKHGYDKSISDELVGKPIISTIEGNKGKPYIFAHELGHATGKSLRKTSGPNSTDSGLRRRAEELRANINGYKILKEEGADKETLKNARKGYYRTSLNIIIGKKPR